MRYNQLDVYKLAYKAASDIHRASLEFPKIEQYGGLADQLRRSSKSICANLAEGFSKRTSRLDERKFLGIAKGSCAEVEVWLQFCKDFGYCSTEQFDIWQETYLRIDKMLHGLMEKRKG